MYRSAGEGLGAALQQIGGLIIENHQWDERRKALREESLAALREEREYRAAERQGELEAKHAQDLIDREDRQIGAENARAVQLQDAATARAQDVEDRYVREAGLNLRAMMRGETTPARERTRLIILEDGTHAEHVIGSGPLPRGAVAYDSAAAKEARKNKRERGPISEGLGRIASAIGGAVARTQQAQPQQNPAAIAEAREAIAAGAPRASVVAELRSLGIDPTGL